MYLLNKTNNIYSGFPEKEFGLIHINFKTFHVNEKKVNNIKAVIFPPLSLKKKIEIRLLSKDVPCLSCLRKEMLLRGYAYFFFIILFSSLHLPTENHIVESFGNFPRTALQSCPGKGGYTLFSTGSYSRIVSNTMPWRRRWEASSFTGLSWKSF